MKHSYEEEIIQSKFLDNQNSIGDLKLFLTRNQFQQYVWTNENQNLYSIIIWINISYKNLQRFAVRKCLKNLFLIYFWIGVQSDMFGIYNM